MNDIYHYQAPQLQGKKFGAWCAAQLRVSIGLYAKTNNLVLLNPQLYDVLLILSQFPK